MTHKHIFTKVGSLVLAACLFFTACGSSVPPSEAFAYPRAVHEEISPADIHYERPDLEELSGKIDQALALTRDGDADGTLSLYREILHDLSHFDTMSSYAGIQYHLDLSDDHYRDEDLALDEAGVQLDNRMIELTDAILDSSFAKKAKSAWGEDFVLRHEQNRKLNSPEIEELCAQEQALVSEYSRLSAEEYTTERDGKPVTLDDLDFSSNDDIKLYFEICQKKNEVLGPIYLELCKLRVEIAKTLGYDNYTDYAYDCLGRDFSKEDAAAFSNDVKEYLVPVSAAAHYFYSQDIMDAQSRSDVTLLDGFDVLDSALTEDGYPEAMHEAFTYMRKCNLYDIGGGQNRMGAAYTTLLNEYGAPFLFINNDLYTDPSTLFHEFGHYYNFYLMGETIWNDGNNLDLAEIHSQGLEVLMFERYEELYGKDADLFRYAQLMNLVDAILQGCIEDAFQQAVFENPDLTLNDANALHGRLSEEYLGYPVYFEWVDIHHHYETPFYYISYATSAVSALELWEIARDDRDHALSVYDHLTQHTINCGYLDTLKDVGLSDPFDSDCVFEIGAALVDEMRLDELSLPEAA